MSGYVPWSGRWSLIPVLYPECRALSVFFVGIVRSIYGVCVLIMRNTATHTSALIAVPVALDPRVDPTSKLALYAVSGRGMQPS